MAVYAYRQPVIAATGAVLVLDEPVGIRLVICGGVVLAGVWFAARSR